MIPKMPKWEWRAFGPDLSLVEDKLAALPVLASMERQETLIVSKCSEAFCMLREDALHLWQTLSRDGVLVQWDEELVLPFPLTEAQIAQVFRAWGLETPQVDGGELPAELFMMILVGGSEELKTVDCQSSSRVYRIDGAEVVQAILHLDGEAVRSLSVSHDDATAVRDVVARLGLRGAGSSFRAFLAAVAPW